MLKKNLDEINDYYQLNPNGAYKIQKTICIVTYYPFIQHYENALKKIIGFFLIKI